MTLEQHLHRMTELSLDGWTFIFSGQGWKAVKPESRPYKQINIGSIDDIDLLMLRVENAILHAKHEGALGAMAVLMGSGSTTMRAEYDQQHYEALGVLMGCLFPEWETLGAAAPVDQELLRLICQEYGLLIA